ncbi:DUF309 domain-containing protein [[Mycobacterium] wendilense]|uniref:DUF309 domain-containing protein n=1 Tax=[Mycobacterium] wendilense TaxID=3064284 RepID=A0ABM9ME38_9MYCO|nr:DUF309 domain-containing protein [Mycolicibacterium sp. MU0050]CAJ1582947.1 DUF309 domain-containing protein [Mycolicibacterium sp. MU0050]
MADRDRDELGKARNLRPRDALGRPLPYGAEGVARIPEDLTLAPEETLTYAQELLDDALAFNAHEVLEAAWKNAPAAERRMWQALAQLAVGITHIQRGNRTGATAILRRAAAGLGEADSPDTHGVDIDGLVRHALGLAEDLLHDNEIAEERLRPVLRRDATR